MPETAIWIDVGDATELASRALQEVDARGTKIALVHRDGAFTALSGVCNHVGGPLGAGRLDGEYVVCAWHHWRFHAATGRGFPGHGEQAVPAYAVKVAGGRVLVDLASATPRVKKPFVPHPLARPVVREPGPVRVVGISTTNRNAEYPRYSTSEALLEVALGHAKDALGARTTLIRLDELAFRACEGYYSVSAHACTWPCTITSQDPDDQLDRVYEALVHGADVILVATPIRWGAPSSLYLKMVERMNCVQNQQTLADRVLMKDKVAAFLITGGQDNVQAVAGQMLTFFAEIGCQFPQFPFIAHSRGWTAEDMENNVRTVAASAELHQGARALVERAVDLSKTLLAGTLHQGDHTPGGRKSHPLDARDRAP